MDIVEQLRKSANTVYSQDGYTFRLGLQNEAANEIEQLREEKEILKIALQNIKECIAHKGEDEKDRDEMADHAYMVTAIVIGLGSVR